MKQIILTAAAAAAMVLTACGGAGNSGAGAYKVSATVSPDLVGQRAYIVNYDTGEPVDSVDITSETLVFEGTIDEPVIGRLMFGGNRGPRFVLEPGEVVFAQDMSLSYGTPLNDAITDLRIAQQKIVDQFNALADDSASAVLGKELEARYAQLADSTMNANIDNPVGYILFVEKAYELDLAALDQAMAAHPSLAKSKRLADLRESLQKKAETSVGSLYKDFAIEYEGNTSRLSDYVGKGRYTLVDFWASWCGPCMREIPNIRQLYDRYGKEGLDVLGVAVWDDPANSQRAVADKQMTWPQILNAQNVATDIYGISSIPTIIVFDPEGRIVIRGLQGEELDKAMAQLFSSKS